MYKFEIVEADPSQAKEICSVLCRSITEVCGPDYGNDRAVLDDWLSNKTPENVANWVSGGGGCSVVAKCGREIIGFALVKEGEI
ncbi:MAG: GNAT family N-acetyltransferase, partial [Gammaproteobacteria bacterium]